MSRSSNPDLQQLNMESLVTDWEKLETAIKEGAKHYLSARASEETAAAKKGKSAASGVYHGGEGFRRADNLQTYPTNGLNHLRLFALLFAVFSPIVNYQDRFESRSSWLVMCIANELIQGRYYRSTAILSGNSDNTITIDKLSTQILNPTALAISKTDPSALDIISGDATEVTYNKSKAIKSFLLNARDNMTRADRSVFDSQVALFKKQLVAKPNATRSAARKAPTPNAV
jgi:hypothetical protein